MWRVLVAFTSVALSACGGPSTISCDDDESVTWADVAPVFADHCTRCHSTTLARPERHQAPARYNYDTYEAAKKEAVRAASVTRSGAMPNDKPGSMTHDEVCLVQNWVKNNEPEGEPELPAPE